MTRNSERGREGGEKRKERRGQIGWGQVLLLLMLIILMFFFFLVVVVVMLFLVWERWRERYRERVIEIEKREKRE